MAFKTSIVMSETKKQKSATKGYSKTLARLKKPEYDPLKKEEEAKLFRKWKITKDEQIKEEIIKRNLRFCVSVCRKYRVFHIQEEDLFQVACMALLIDFPKFDPDRGVKFISYAVNRIRHELLEFVNDNLH